MGEYRDLLRSEPAFRSLWLSDLVSQTGDWFSMVAISIAASSGGDSPGGAIALATVLCAHMLPMAMLSPIAGFVADRFDRKKILLYGNLAECALTLVMVAAIASGAVVALTPLLFLRSGVAAMREPAAGAALPRLVPPEKLGTANTLAASTWSLTFVIGMALGGIATEAGPTVAIAIDAGTFVLAALLLAKLPAIVPQRDLASTGTTIGSKFRELGTDLSAGWREASKPRIRASVFAKTPMAIVSGVGWLAFELAARDVPFIAGGAAATLGVLQAIRGFGTGVGPAAARRWIRKGSSPGATLHVVGLVIGVGASAMAWVDSPALMVLAVLVWGAGSGAVWVLTMTEIQSRSADAMRGRLLALDGIGFTVGMATSALVSAIMVGLGVSLALVSAAMFTFSAALWIWIRSGNTDEDGPRSAALARTDLE